MPATSVPYQPIGGINSEMSEDQIGETQVRDAVNFLFERGESRTRPAAVEQALGSIGGVPTKRLVWGQSRFENLFGRQFTIVIEDVIAGQSLIFELLGDPVGTKQVWSIPTAGGPFTFRNIRDLNAAQVGSDFLIANCFNGMVRVRYDSGSPGIGTLCSSLNAASSYKLVTSQQARAIGAHYLETPGPEDRQKIGWCASGDVTNWTTLDSGSTILSDAADMITGLGVINNIVVVLRLRGIHLGYLTGVSAPAYRWETFIREGVGCFYQGTAAFGANECFFVGEDDVYRCDLSTVDRMGGDMKTEILTAVRQHTQGVLAGQTGDLGRCYRGLIVRQASHGAPRMQYHLVPSRHTFDMAFPSSPAGDRTGLSQGPEGWLPQFIYDIAEKKWSKHVYDVPIYGACEVFDEGTVAPNGTLGRLILFHDAIAKVKIWDPKTPCETASFLRSKLFTFGEGDHDATLTRAQVRYRNTGQTDLAITASASINDTVKENTDTQACGNEDANDRWLRKWFNVHLPGNDFEIRLDVPAGQKCAVNKIVLEVADGGAYQGS